ncbi:MAG: hypothetical protein JSV16_05840 [Candidatus Hydrogenedentota bacterium]|nr:MAG: hypothetical protein JSV16_05840 [Candidatus Hydrogenedentota bacterium]
MQDGNVVVDRYDPARASCIAHSYFVPLKERATVLEALLYIYENYDSTLAFRYGCRSAKCGECAVEVDGNPRLACLANAREGMRISPLKKLPPIRDLVVDRSVVDRRISAQRLYVRPRVENALGVMLVPETYKRLTGCLECYGCISSCPHFDWRDEKFGGPYIFVRLAQLHLDPRDKEDRRAQAMSLGIRRCSDCFQCRCVRAIAIRRDAIETLLGKNDAQAGELR